MTARDIQRKLSQLYYLTQEVERDELRLRELRAAAEKSTQQITGMPGAGGEGDRVGRYAIEIAELRRRLEEKQRACFCELTRLEDFIASVEDSQMRIILTLRYVQRMSWQRVATEMGEADESYPTAQALGLFTKSCRKCRKIYATIVAGATGVSWHPSSF